MDSRSRDFARRRVRVRTKLIDDDEGLAIASKIEDFAKARLDFTNAAADADVPAQVA